MTIPPSYTQLIPLGFGAQALAQRLEFGLFGSTVLSFPQVVKNIQFIANYFREQRATCVKVAEWKKVAKVMDRFFMWIFFVMVFLMSILIIAKAS